MKQAKLFFAEVEKLKKASAAGNAKEAALPGDAMPADGSARGHGGAPALSSPTSHAIGGDDAAAHGGGVRDGRRLAAHGGMQR